MQKRENRLPEVPLTEKCLLSLDELCTYVGLGKGSAADLAKNAGAIRYKGRRRLYSRERVDEHCYENDEL